MIDHLVQVYGWPRLGARALWPSLWLLSWVYRAIVTVRNLWYDRHRPQAVGLRTISVGNIHVGGTGKTPLILEMLKRLEDRSIRTCVVLRGYGSRGGVSDEAELYKSLVGQDAVFVGQDRVKSLRLAKQQGFELAIMDDAFQHRRAHRDFDLVLIDATRPPMADHLLPAGLMREGLGALARASEVWLTRTEQCEPEQLVDIENVLSQRGMRTARVETSVRGLRPLFANASPPQAEKYHCVSAIGHPENFKATVLSMGLDVVGESWFPDHHHFSRLEQIELIEKAQRADFSIVMTSKDAVKWSEAGPVFVLEIASVLPQPHFDEVLERLF